MLVVGSQYADYAPLHPADDLARCLRYYEIIGESTNEIQWNGYGGASIGTGMVTPFKVRKAVSPTVTKNGTWGSSNCGQPGVVASGLTMMTWQVVATTTGGFGVNNAAGCDFRAEANP
jgi:hypothetical protein